MWKAFPTWLIVWLCEPFLPPTHSLYGRRFLLYVWYQNRTPLCRFLDLALWLSGILAVISWLIYWLV